MDMDRRTFIGLASVGACYLLLPQELLAAGKDMPVGKLFRTDAQWKQLLTPAQFHILREQGTEYPYSSPLNKEKRTGMFACVACGLELFPSRFKFDSGTGWPSFFDVLPGHVETSRDTTLGMVRTEYHCARCGGHHGHVFNDGPKPTGLRYCNNGVALRFIPEGA